MDLFPGTQTIDPIFPEGTVGFCERNGSKKMEHDVHQQCTVINYARTSVGTNWLFFYVDVQTVRTEQELFRSSTERANCRNQNIYIGNISF